MTHFGEEFYDRTDDKTTHKDTFQKKKTTHKDVSIVLTDIFCRKRN